MRRYIVKLMLTKARQPEQSSLASLPLQSLSVIKEKILHHSVSAFICVYILVHSKLILLSSFILISNIDS